MSDDGAQRVANDDRCLRPDQVEPRVERFMRISSIGDLRERFPNRSESGKPFLMPQTNYQWTRPAYSQLN
jgi:hypothetical protein